MSIYTLVLFTHILGALGLFTTTGTTLLILIRLRRARTVAQARDLLELAHALARFEPIIALALLGPGLYLTATVWGWQVAWINLSLGAMAALVIVGGALGAPRVAARASAVAAAPDGPISAALATRVNDPVFWTLPRVALALEVGIIFLMTVKPGLLDSLVALSVALALGLTAAAPRWRHAHGALAAREAPAGE